MEALILKTEIFGAIEFKRIFEGEGMGRWRIKIPAGMKTEKQLSFTRDVVDFLIIGSTKDVVVQFGGADFHLLGGFPRVWARAVSWPSPINSDVQGIIIDNPGTEDAEVFIAAVFNPPFEEPKSPARPKPPKAETKKDE